MTHTQSSAESSAFFRRKSTNFAISRSTDIDCILIHNFEFFLTDFESSKISLKNMFAILMISGKMATLDFLKLKLFQNEGYDVIIYVHDITNQILSCDPNYIVDLVI